MKRRALLLLFSTLLTLGVVELGLRYFFVPVGLAHPTPMGLGLEGADLVADQVDYKISMKYNRDAFRSPEFAAEKQPGVKRLEVLGDSFSEGFGVPLEERFSTLLAHRLPSWDEVNLAQLGTNPDTYFGNLVDFGVAFQPDFVVIGVFLGNDFMNERDHPVPAYKVNQRLPARPSSFSYLGLLLRQAVTHERLLDPRCFYRQFWDFFYKAPVNRALYMRILKLTPEEFDRAVGNLDREFVQESLRGRINPSFLSEALLHQLKRPEYLYNEADFNHTAELLVECAKVLDERHIPYVVLMIPDMFTTFPEKGREYLKMLGFEQPPQRLLDLEGMQERIQERFQQQKVHYLDLTPALRASKEFPYHFHDQHFNRAGHQVAANELYLYMSRLAAQQRL